MFLQIVPSTGEVENVNDEEIDQTGEQKGLDVLSSNSPSIRKSVPQQVRIQSYPFLIELIHFGGEI